MIYCPCWYTVRVFFKCKYKFKKSIFSFFFWIDIDECSGSPCNHGSCINKVNSFICECNFGYIGISCDQCNFFFQNIPNFKQLSVVPLIFVNINIFSLKRSIISLTAVVKTFCFRVSFRSDFLNLSVFLGNSKRLIVQRLYLHYYNWKEFCQIKVQKH